MFTLKRIPVLCLLAVMVAFFTGCKKQGSYNYTFVNQSDKQINIYIYRTEADYNGGKWPAISGTINAHGNYAVPSGALEDSKDYYVDWYSSDLMYSNWGDSTQANKFTPSGSVKTFNINPTQPNYMRKLALDYDLLKTNWIGVDAYDTANPGVSVWATMTDKMKYRVLNIQRGFVADYEYMDGNDSEKDNYIYTIRQNGNTITMIFKDERTHTLTAQIPAGGNLKNIDTAWFSFYDKVYKLAKQH